MRHAPGQPARDPGQETAAATRWLAYLAGLALLTGLPATFYNLRELRSKEPPPTSTVSNSAATSVSAVATGSPTTDQRSGPSPTTGAGCYRLEAPVPCSSTHTSEVFPAENCDRESLLHFLGGTPGVDQLSGGISIEPTKNSSCRVTGDVVEALARSLQDVLDDPLGDKLRACALVASGEFVGCDTPHTAELIYLGKKDVDCRQPFRAYADIAFQGHDTALKLQKVADESVACWVQTRSANTLTSSLRHLGTRDLPLS